MRIAYVHSFYRSAEPSGENVVVADQARLLSNAGHEVLVVARHTDEESRGRSYGLRAALTVATGVGPDPTKELAEFAPDIVHVHNLFPNFGTRWLARWRGPLVATIHNARPLCARYSLQRNGRPCTLCPDHSTINAVIHSCYRDSHIAAVPWAVGATGGLRRNPVIRRAEAVITVHDSMRETLLRYGADGTRLHLIRNGVADIEPGDDVPLDAWVTVGRLDETKGIAELVRMWPDDRELHVFGASEPESLQRTNINWHGVVAHSELRRQLHRYHGMVFAGTSPVEDTPLAVVEALSAGVPVIASSGSPTARRALRDGFGLTFDSASTLAAALEATESDGDLRRGARDAFVRDHGSERWLAATVDLYERVRRDWMKSHSA